MYEKGKRLYYVQSLLFPAVRCTVIESMDTKTGNDRFWIVAANDETGELIKDYSQKFSASKPRKYIAHVAANKYSSVYFDNANKKPVTLETLKESWKAYNHIYKQSFDEYMLTLTEKGLMVPYADYLRTQDNY